MALQFRPRSTSNRRPSPPSLALLELLQIVHSMAMRNIRREQIISRVIQIRSVSGSYEPSITGSDGSLGELGSLWKQFETEGQHDGVETLECGYQLIFIEIVAHSDDLLIRKEGSFGAFPEDYCHGEAFRSQGFEEVWTKFPGRLTQQLGQEDYQSTKFVYLQSTAPPSQWAKA